MNKTAPTRARIAPTSPLARLSITCASEAPEHGDAADLLATGSAADVDALIAAAAPLTRPGPVLVRLASVQREALSPVWDGHLYRGKLHLIEGDPGLCKTTAALDVAARVSRGAAMPDGSPGLGPAGVVIMGAEDGLADTVRPRLEAAGADLDRIVALTAIVDADGERLPALPLDLAAVESAIREVDAALVIVDPLMAFLDSSVNSWRDQDVRRALAPLARLAERTACAVILIRHLNKSAGSHAMYRGGGRSAMRSCSARSQPSWASGPRPGGITRDAERVRRPGLHSAGVDASRNSRTSAAAHAAPGYFFSPPLRKFGMIGAS